MKDKVERNVERKVRLSRHLFELIDVKVEESGLTFSEYVRECCLQPTILLDYGERELRDETKFFLGRLDHHLSDLLLEIKKEFSDKRVKEIEQIVKEFYEVRCL